MTIPTPLLGILPPETTDYVTANPEDLAKVYEEVPMRIPRKIIVVDRTNGFMISIRESQYNKYLARGYFGFMINPEFGQGVFEENYSGGQR